METETAKRHQTLMILWFAMLMNMGILFLVAFIAAPDTNGSPSKLLTFVLAAVATFLVGISFAVKRKFFEQSVNRQDMSLVQKGLVVAWAICEVCAMIGLLERFLIGNRDYFVLFLLGAIGIALHFPRRDDLRSANYKTPSGGGIGS
ncbi:MAG TPA: hypothetical protein VNO50_19525 [Pyrinomonadaceae bacterium]|nr:hypothetical protein [Pyrinomonadaceae bacterium]